MKVLGRKDKQVSNVKELKRNEKDRCKSVQKTYFGNG